MSDAPRWPGSDGGPGLDFSPYRTDEPPKSPVSPADDTHVQRAVSPAEGESHDGGRADTDEPKAAEDAREAQGAEQDAKSADDGKGTGGQGDKGIAPVTPRVAERAERTAKEWASMPVGTAFPGVDPGPAAPAASGAPVAGATAATAAVGVTGAAARSQASPAVAPQPGRAAGPDMEEADPLPLEEVADKKDEEVKPVRKRKGPRRTRKARLRLARLDPWSVMKTTFLFAIAFGIMFVVATFVLWSVLAGAGTMDYVNTLLNQLFGDQDTEFDVTRILTVNRILGFSAIVAAINVVIITALATLFAFLYNLAATVMGGLELTLAED